MARMPFVCGNWKLNKTPEEARALAQELRSRLGSTAGVEVGVCPPFVSIPAVVEALKGSTISVGGQDIFWMEKGAYTGEVSGPMLASAGCRYVIVGHSERRGRFAKPGPELVGDLIEVFGDNDTTVNRKALAALASGLRPIICVGETLDERQAGRTEVVVEAQVRAALAGISPQQAGEVVFAYEPVWAIGTGEKCNDQEANRVCGLVRKVLAQVLGAEQAQGIRVLYGGSVDAQNAPGLMGQPEVDGGLVGGKSLVSDDFEKIVTAAQQGKGRA
jgi:triosephosphate isomerase